MMTSFVGVDLHRNNFTYCIRVNGEERKIGKCEITELKGFAAMLGPNTAMAVEATGNTFMFCSSLKAHVGRLVVVNPSQFKVISMSTKKTDKHDAKVLAEFLEKDMLPEVRVKDDLQAKISSLTQTREKLVQLRTVLKNKVNNLLA
ncbi:transposase [Victivallis sp. Marseille-Q1083]|uniref:IS110 family transposase n=1 Tax=Victivallis sp. Marseille-Q1083 TaxID=2717288 RepID=UPI00158B133A|nr:transposase [Victivallis sp. Marseille-Q1083]